MGLEPEEYEGGYGVECVHCWGAGKPWEDKRTPAVVTVTFGGIIACPEACDAPNGVFTLAQVPGVPCRWRTTIPNWCHGFILDMRWSLTNELSSLVVTTHEFYEYYFHDIIGPCQTHFTNDGDGCYPGHYMGYNGIGVIT